MIEGLTFDDVLLLPNYSELDSRHEADPSVEIFNIHCNLPIMSAPMDTVTEENMAIFLYERGGLGVIHRYNYLEEQSEKVKWVKEMGGKVGAAIGINGDTEDRITALHEAGVDFVVIDVGHGDSLGVYERIEKTKANYPELPVVSANIVTSTAAKDSIIAGADALRVGVGPGGACTTRVVAGVGCPQFTAIQVVKKAAGSSPKNVPVIADGGIRTSGDIVKALAAGADMVMLGSMLAALDVSAGPQYFKTLDEISPITKQRMVVKYKHFRGMASEAALKTRKKDRVFAEGAEFEVPVNGDPEGFIESLRDGIRTGMAYVGAKTLRELKTNAEWVKVSASGYREGTAHFLGQGR